MEEIKTRLEAIIAELDGWVAALTPDDSPDDWADTLNRLEAAIS